MATVLWTDSVITGEGRREEQEEEKEEKAGKGALKTGREHSP